MSQMVLGLLVAGQKPDEIGLAAPYRHQVDLMKFWIQADQNPDLLKRLSVADGEKGGQVECHEKEEEEEKEEEGEKEEG